MTDAAELARQEIEWRKILNDFGYFVDTYCQMWEKQGGDPIPFRLWEFQWDVASKMQKEKKLIVLKARQMGLSWLASAYTLWKVLTIKNFHVYYTSIGLREVQEQMERVRFIFLGLPFWVQDRVFLGGKNCKDNDSIIEFTNKSAIHATASSKSAGHGAAPGLIIGDEWSRVENAQHKWRALKPSAGANTQIFLISTSDGFNNHFADMWMEAVAGGNGFVPVFYSWRDHPMYSAEYIEEQKRDFAGDLQGFMEAFPEKPEDAFMSAARSIFDFTRIREWKEYIRTSEVDFRVGYLDKDAENKRVFIENEAEHLMVWREPVAGHHYAIGVDVAEGLTGGDYSAFVVLDCDTDEVVALYRSKISPEYYAHPIEECARWYNNAYLVVEVNTASELIMSDLKNNYPYLYLRPQRQKITDLPTLVPGFYSSATSKPRIITQLRRYFSDNEKPLRIYSDVILDEMAAYEQNDRGRLAAATGHDDTVMALAIATEGKYTYPYADDYNQVPSIGLPGSKEPTWHSL